MRQLWFPPFLDDESLRPWQVAVLVMLFLFGLPLLLLVAVYPEIRALPPGLGRRVK